MTEKTYEMVDRARESGLDVGFDMHTRVWGELNISAMLPLWALAGSREEIDAGSATRRSGRGSSNTRAT